jgi:hypothetical protein
MAGSHNPTSVSSGSDTNDRLSGSYVTEDTSTAAIHRSCHSTRRTPAPCRSRTHSPRATYNLVCLALYVQTRLATLTNLDTPLSLKCLGM